MAEKLLKDLERELSLGLSALEKKFLGLRVGRARPELLENLTVEIYGGKQSLGNVSSISAPQPQLLVIEIWDSSIKDTVEKALRKASYSPNIEGNRFSVPIPSPTKERRNELIKISFQYAEEIKVGFRNQRRAVLDGIEKRKKEDNISEDLIRKFKQDVDKIVNGYVEKVDILKKKQEEIVKSV
ncbi:ribosome-recycling factor [Holospora obtusa F1]|uniref:Ribosome-recycling factor n=1 Tax=Holospora obtusa F1 TaxID=1399147 RepID=W6TE88_HOLOB|nr:ribosome-recycling factor [Holospora obtusa]ETZ07468.1 ribosome-recycling factor [Holospora obtusa F1]